MSAVFVCPRPRTGAEKRMFAAACRFKDLLVPPGGGALDQPQFEGLAPRLDVYGTTPDPEFELDRPVIAARLAAANPPPRALSAAEADAWLNRTLAALGDSITGGGIVVQTAWNVAGGGEWAGAAVDDWLK